MKIKARLTLFYSAATTVIMLCFGLLLYLGMRVILFSEIDRELAHTADLMVQSNINDLSFFNYIDSRLDALKNNTQLGIMVLDADGKPVFQSEIAKKVQINPGNLNMKKTVRFLNYAIETVHQNISMKDGTSVPARYYRVLLKRFFYRNVPLGWIQISQPIDNIVIRLAQLKRSIFFTFPIILIIISLTGYFLADRLLSPIQSIISSAGRINDNNLSERISNPGTKDELNMLIGTLNSLFDRLEDSFNSQKQFISDAAHELKTPLAILRTSLETEIANESLDVRIRNKLLQNVDTVSRLSTLVEKLLFLSRLENRKISARLETIDLFSLLSRIKEDLGVLLEEKKQYFTVSSETPLTIAGDEDLIYQAFFNIINNAAKYTPMGGRIEISLKKSGETAVVTVMDNGIGMNMEEVNKAFNRFFRADKSRSEEKGYGLGLSITKWIVSLHKGKISIDSSTGEGTKVCVELPSS